MTMSESMSESKAMSVSKSMSTVSKSVAVSVSKGLRKRLSSRPVGNWLMDGPWLSDWFVNGSVVKLRKWHGEKDELLLSLEQESQTGKLLQLVQFPSRNFELGITLRGKREEHQGNDGDQEEECGETHFLCVYMELFKKLKLLNMWLYELRK